MTPALVEDQVANQDTGRFFSGLFKEAYDNLPEDIKKLSQEDLEKIKIPTENDFFLRERMWNLIETAQKTNQASHIPQARLYAGICSHQNFAHLMKDPIRVAWLFIPPQEDMNRMRYGLSLAMRNLIEFVSNPPQEKMAGAWIKAAEILINRVHGPMVQRVEAKHAHLNLNKPITPQPLLTTDERLAELKQKLEAAKDVTQQLIEPPTSG